MGANIFNSLSVSKFSIEYLRQCPEWVTIFYIDNTLILLTIKVELFEGNIMYGSWFVRFLSMYMRKLDFSCVRAEGKILSLIFLKNNPNSNLLSSSYIPLLLFTNSLFISSISGEGSTGVLLLSSPTFYSCLNLKKWTVQLFPPSIPNSTRSLPTIIWLI